ncbi:MAG TPA: alpha/beta fold hydrolase [Solirubrobacteraceae bacterium]|jgi:3-oxoadipate enol-lactonase|nr:alpha/beta fold hydrolase [Solirubrobacteraceae bacterium]
MPVIDTGEVKLAYERSGSGPPLLLIMGMSGTFSHWAEPFLDELRASFEVIVYDHRGVGQSSPLQGELTIAGLAQDAVGLLGALDLDSAHVLGISMGGMVAQELALARPERIRTLALGCTYCGGPGSSLASPEVIQRLAAGMSSGDRALAVRTAWEVNVSPAFDAAHPDAFETFRAIGMTRAVAVPVIMAQMQACAAHDTSARLPQLQLPTLVAHGTLDLMIPVANAAIIHRLIPGSQLEILDGLGHLFFWEQPQRAAALVRDHAAVGV